MSKLPDAYRWLDSETAPRILVEALRLYGTSEVRGKANNPVILEWARGLSREVAAWYTQDEYAWCALYVSHVCRVAGLEVPSGFKAVRALGFLTWGTPVDAAMLGDVLVFKRDGGGHVGIYVGEDAEAYHVLGGNQGDRVSIVRIAKARCIGIRRTRWKVAQPPTVRRVVLSVAGGLSVNEA